jgi:hypothetical protein
MSKILYIYIWAIYGLYRKFREQRKTNKSRGIFGRLIMSHQFTTTLVFVFRIRDKYIWFDKLQCFLIYFFSSFCRLKVKSMEREFFFFSFLPSF